MLQLEVLDGTKERQTIIVNIECLQKRLSVVSVLS